MAGLGLGIAFFNALDFSIWRTSPMSGGLSFGDSLKDRAFYGFSFDIKLTEYISAAQEKRRLRKVNGVMR